MNANYTFFTTNSSQGHNMILVCNYHSLNEVAHFHVSINSYNIESCCNITGVWLPKGTKRPKNWPTKRR